MDVCREHERRREDDSAMTRLIVLGVALVFIAGLAFLTVAATLEQGGLTILGLVSIFVLVLLAVGIVGALRNPPRQ